MLFAIIFSSLLWCYRYWWLLFFIFLSCYHLVSMHITCLCVFQCLCVVCWWYWLMLTVLRVCVPNYPSRVLVNGRWCMRIRRRQRFTTTHLYVTQTRTIKKNRTYSICNILCLLHVVRSNKFDLIFASFRIPLYYFSLFYQPFSAWR